MKKVTAYRHKGTGKFTTHPKLAVPTKLKVTRIAKSLTSLSKSKRSKQYG